MLTKDLIEQKISNIKEEGLNKVRSGNLEIIPCTPIKINGESGIQFKHMQKIDNLLFHFTKQENFKYFFDDHTLLLNQSKNMTDPIENEWYFENIGTGAQVNTLMRNNVRFTCFCKPFLEIEDNKIPAYALSRMWNQYGDNYRGCCIGFNKEKLEELLMAQYPDSFRIGEIKYDLPLDPEYGISVIHTATTTDSTLKIYEDGKGSYKQWDDSMAKELYLSSDMFGFLFRKAFDYRDENEIRFSIYDSSDEKKFIHNIDSAIDVVIFGYQVEDNEAFKYDLLTQATIYKLYFVSPYRLVNNTINQHWTKGSGRLIKITTPETSFLKKFNLMKDKLSDDAKIKFLNLYDKLRVNNINVLKNGYLHPNTSIIYKGK